MPDALMQMKRMPRDFFFRVCFLLVFFLSNALLSRCASSRQQPGSFQPRADGEWKTSTFAEAGFDEVALRTCLNEILSRDANFHSLIVERSGRLVVEAYRSGRDRPFNHLYGSTFPFTQSEFDARTLHDVRSSTKSVIGILYGIALAKKLVPQPDESVVANYPGLENISDDKKAITYEHLLTMSSGLEWNEWVPFFVSDETPLLWKKDLAQYFFNRPLTSHPGSTFNYSGGSTAVLADTLSRALHSSSGKTLEEFARSELFEKLGITQWEWVLDFRDRPMPHAGLRLRPRDMAKLGRLMLNGGVFHGIQIVPGSWVEASIKKRIQTGVRVFSGTNRELGYGYQWWTGETEVKGRMVEWKAAIGNGGQQIILIPAFDMSIVMTAGDYGSPDMIHTEATFMDAILQTFVETSN